MKYQELESERLLLRQFTPDDAEAVYSNWAGDPEATRYMPLERASSVEKARTLISQWSDTVFALVLKSTGELIGLVEYDITDEEARAAELVYIIGKKWWHNGYVAEALSALLKYAFEVAKLNRVWACHDPRNPNSGAVMRKCRMQYEGFSRQCKVRDGELVDRHYYAILAEDYFGNPQETNVPTPSNITTLKTSTDLMFHNLKISMDTVDWNADVCGAPAWRYIYHTLHSADKFFISPSSWVEEDEPPFHSHMLDWPDTPKDTVVSKEVLFAYFDEVRQKVISYVDSLNDVQLYEQPGGNMTRLGLMLSQFRHMYAHIGILNGVTIANTSRYPLVINEGAWRAGNLPEELYDVEERR